MITLNKRYRRASLRKKIPVLRMNKICRVVAKYYGLGVPDLREKNRKRVVVEPRQIAIFFMCEINDLTYRVIGEYFSGLDHTTVMYSCSMVYDLMDTNEQYKSDVEQIKALIAA